MCPRISVPASSSSSSHHPLTPPSRRCIRVCLCVYTCAHVQASARAHVYIHIKNPTSASVHTRGGGLPSCTDTLLLPPFSPGVPMVRARTVIFLPISFSTYNLHASIVQTDDGNYLRFSANAINQKRRSASPAGPLGRQGYQAGIASSCCPVRSPSLLLHLSTRLDSTRLRRLIIHD